MAATEVAAGAGMARGEGISEDAALAKRAAARNAATATPEESTANAAGDAGVDGEADAYTEAGIEMEGEEARTDDDQDAEGQVDGDEDDSTDDDAESAQFSSLRELADAAGMEMDAFMNEIAADIDGERVPLRNLIGGYRGGRAVEAERTSLKEAREAFEAERTQSLEQVTATIAQTQAMSQALEDLAAQRRQALEAEAQGIDWNRLDPGQRALATQQFQHAVAAVENDIGGLRAKANETVQAAQAALAARRDELVASTTERLAAEFGLESGEAGRGVVQKYVSDTYGATDAELVNLFTDPRIAIMAEKARQFDALKVQRAEVVKPKKGPQLVRGARQGGADPTKARAVKANRDALKASGSEDAAVRLVVARQRPR